MNISICIPAKSKGGNDWYCTWQVSSEFGYTQKKAFGIDAVQSFSSALLKAEAQAIKYVSSNKVEWIGGKNVQLLPKSKH